MFNYAFEEIHKLLINNKELLEGFNSWELSDKDGLSVAHTATMCGNLPDNFNRWDIVDNDGWSIAHAAAMHNYLPVDFNQWDLPSPKGTVREVYERYNK